MIASQSGGRHAAPDNAFDRSADRMRFIINLPARVEYR
jgi:hypothetical protein